MSSDEELNDTEEEQQDDSENADPEEATATADAEAEEVKLIHLFSVVLSYFSHYSILKLRFKTKQQQQKRRNTTTRKRRKKRTILASPRRKRRRRPCEINFCSKKPVCTVISSSSAKHHTFLCKKANFLCFYSNPKPYFYFFKII